MTKEIEIISPKIIQAYKLSAWAARTYSQDANSQTGSIILSKDNEIIGIGANRARVGNPLRYEGIGERVLFERPPKEGTPKYETFDFNLNKYDEKLFAHGEEDAIADAKERGLEHKLKGATLVLNWIPCLSRCAKSIVEAGISTVYGHGRTDFWYQQKRNTEGRFDWDSEKDAAKPFFEEQGVAYHVLFPKLNEQILFDDELRIL